MADDSQKARLRWAVCGLLFLITTVNYMDRSALGLVEPILKHMLGADQDVNLYNRHYSDIVTCFIVAYGAGLLVAGRVIDRIGAKMGLALSIAVWSVASVSHAFARTVLGFAVARFALGLGEAGNFPAALKATADCFPAEERALATGIFNSGTSAASLIAPLLVPWVALRFGWQAAFFTTGGLSLLWLCCWLLFPYNRLQRQLSDSAEPAAKRPTFVSLLRARGTWAFAGSKAFTDPVWWFYLFWLPKFFHERFQVEMSQLGLPLIIVYVGATVGSIAGGWLAGYVMRRGRPLRSARRFAMTICAVCALAVTLVPFVHVLWQAIGLLCLATAAHQGWSSNLLSTPSDLFASGSVGTVVGIGGAIGSVGSTLFTTATGILWTDHALLIFSAAGCAYLLAMAAFQRPSFAPAAEE
ncbi:MAG TPA: MFS transporter [Terracidiphilus sp.]|nr:MFS transporter [Terracidiphilus sp.]